jgi:D-glycero-D-manno-heptose 1,7-bisphosphate phosphatase
VKPALFLDRDGVINEDRHYVHRIEDFRFLDGIFDLCHSATRAEMAIIVVTNQAGIGRGIFTEQQFHDLTDWMTAHFQDKGIRIQQVYFCPHHPTHGIGRYRSECSCRKPNPGMILRARDDHDIDLQNSVLIGDKPWDIAAAKAAGVGTSVLVSAPGVVLTEKPDFQFATLDDVNCAFYKGRLY